MSEHPKASAPPAPRSRLIFRMYRGIHDHFPARRSEWVLAGMMIAWGITLSGPEDVFTQSAAWTQMAALADESTWSAAAIAIGSFRLCALAINGTFSHTAYGRFSPHVRALASFVSCFLWLQISFGLLQANIITTALAVYPGLLALDMMNVVAASTDAAGIDKAKANDS